MSNLAVRCSGCGNVLSFRVDCPATICCQICGSKNGVILFGDEKSKIVQMTCSSCKKEFFLSKGIQNELGCPECGAVILTAVEDFQFSRFVHLPFAEAYKSYPVEKIIFKTDLRIKIAIPYFEGDKRVARAVRTWIIPEVVWILTDKGIVPPGWGVCSQIFTEKNAVTEGLQKEKTKPFLKDILRKMLELFPNEEYYGYFNSDIILPPGVSVKHLIPAKDKVVAFHHRQEYSEPKSDTPIRGLKKSFLTVCGKDGFIIRAKILRDIIDDMPDAVLGAPTWDDGFLYWCWQRFGTGKVELRYGEIGHVLHDLNWNPSEPDGVYNLEQLVSHGVDREKYLHTDWGDAERKYSRGKPEQKVMGIVQPGRIGDVIIVLPIAKWYYDNGYKIVWPVCTEFLPLFEYVNYVEPVDLACGVCSEAYRKSLDILRDWTKSKLILDLGIGFGRGEDDWIESGLHFNEWKYHAAKLPFEERFNLQITRDFRKEKLLWNICKEENELNGKGYAAIHDTGTKGPYRFDKKGVRIEPRKDFTIFDWIGIIENADHLYCVDSCVANLADQLKLCVDRRSVWFWQGIPDREPRKSLGFPKLCEDWKVL